MEDLTALSPTITWKIENITGELVDLAKLICKKIVENVTCLLLTADNGMMKEKEDPRKNLDFKQNLEEIF